MSTLEYPPVVVAGTLGSSLTERVVESWSFIVDRVAKRFNRAISIELKGMEKEIDGNRCSFYRTPVGRE